jgi:hypothetical protein
LPRIEPWSAGRAPPPDFQISACAAEYDFVRLTPTSVRNDTRLERPLTAEQALTQINVLGQTGARSEHVGILVVFGQYAAKADTLAAALPAVWLSPDYQTLTEYRRVLRDGGFFAGGVNLLSLYAFPLPSTTLVAAPPPAAAGGQVNLLA